MTATSILHPEALTITAEHRTCLRRVQLGEPVGELGRLLDALYLHDLVRDEGARIVITDDGAGLLAAHDRLAETRRIERPRMASRPVPPRWERDPDDEDGNPGRSFVREPYIVTPTPDGRILIHHVAVEDLAVELAAARDVVALLEWMRHEQAVAEQSSDGVPS